MYIDDISFFFLDNFFYYIQNEQSKNLKWRTESKDPEEGSASGSSSNNGQKVKFQNGIGPFGRSVVSPVVGKAKYIILPLCLTLGMELEPHMTHSLRWHPRGDGTRCVALADSLVSTAFSPTPFVHSLCVFWIKTTAVMRIRLLITFNLYLRIDFAWNYKYLVHQPSYHKFHLDVPLCV